MSNDTFEFQSCIIQYRHDESTFESLNIGIIYYCPSRSLLEVHIDNNTQRLSSAYVDFDTNSYRNIARSIENSINTASKNFFSEQYSLWSTYPSSLKEIVENLWIEELGAIKIASHFKGYTLTPNTHSSHLYHRYVSSFQKQDHRTRREDGAVWDIYNDSLRNVGISHLLTPKEFHLGDGYTQKFDYAVKNGKWHVLQPVTFDYQDTTGIHLRVERILGRSDVLRDIDDIGSFNILTGKPKSKSLLEDYSRAISFLRRKLPTYLCEVVEEHESNDFASRFSEKISNH